MAVKEPHDAGAWLDWAASSGEVPGIIPDGNGSVYGFGWKFSGEFGELVRDPEPVVRAGIAIEACLLSYERLARERKQ